MRRALLSMMSMALLPGYAFAADGQVLINQASVMAAGGFPYTITQPGSYKLSGNLTIAENANRHPGQRRQRHHDLNGFGIIGPTVCVGFPVTSCFPIGGGYGLVSNQINTNVVSGFVRGMGSDGIRVNDGSIRNVHANSNGHNGLAVGNGSVIFMDNVSNSNGKAGFLGAGIFSGNIAMFNADVGMFIECPSTVIGNTSNQNGSTNLLIFKGCAVANNAAP